MPDRLYRRRCRAERLRSGVNPPSLAQATLIYAEHVFVGPAELFVAVGALVVAGLSLGMPAA
jgi:hypothetical protein